MINSNSPRKKHPAFTTLVNRASHLDPPLNTKHHSFEQIFSHILLERTFKKQYTHHTICFPSKPSGCCQNEKQIKLEQVCKESCELARTIQHVVADLF